MNERDKQLATRLNVLGGQLLRTADAGPLYRDPRHHRVVYDETLRTWAAEVRAIELALRAPHPGQVQVTGEAMVTGLNAGAP